MKDANNGYYSRNGLLYNRKPAEEVKENEEEVEDKEEDAGGKTNH